MSALANINCNMSRHLAIAAHKGYVVREVLLILDLVTRDVTLVPFFELLKSEKYHWNY
jgi:hypothetical protein